MTAAPHFRTKADIARHHIEELILSGAARAGTRLTTRQIADAIDMSETPVREAVRSLAADGWLELRPHIGIVVASIRREHVAEVYALRGTLEALAIRLGGASLTTKPTLAALDDNIARAEAAVAAGDVARYARLNREFHRILAEAPETEWTLKLLRTLWAQTSALQSGFEAVPDRLRGSLDEHRAIRAALGIGDSEAAARIVIEHERIAGARLIAALSRAADDD
jgi:DNA-binding GntR family transcriptional regulator